MNHHTIRQTILVLEDKINEATTRIHAMEGDRDSLITSLGVATSNLNFMKHEREKNQKLLREYLDFAEHGVFLSAEAADESQQKSS